LRQRVLRRAVALAGVLRRAVALALFEEVGQWVLKRAVEAVGLEEGCCTSRGLEEGCTISTL
jgi:hypothetical protein